MKTLGERIKEAADELGGLNQLAERLPIARRTLGHWVSGESEPKASQVITIAGLTGVDLRWLLLGEGEKCGDQEPGSQSFQRRPASPISSELMVDIEQAIHNAYAIAGGGIARQDSLRLSIDWYNQLVSEGADVTNGRETAVMIYDMRKALEADLKQRAAGNETSSKRQGS